MSKLDAMLTHEEDSKEQIKRLANDASEDLRDAFEDEVKAARDEVRRVKRELSKHQQISLADKKNQNMNYSAWVARLKSLTLELAEKEYELKTITQLRDEYCGD